MVSPGTRPSLSQELIVNTSFDLIQQNGLQNFSLRTLARELSVSPMTIYGYFPSKHAIIDAVAKKLRGMYDTALIPGESWDDSLRRTAGSIRRVALAHPEIFVASSGWMTVCQNHSELVYQLHRNQGVPPQVFRYLWSTVEAFLVGFITQEIAQQKAGFTEDDSDDANSDWMHIIETAFGDRAFEQGLDWIIAGIKQTYPEEANWRTPWNSPI